MSPESLASTFFLGGFSGIILMLCFYELFVTSSYQRRTRAYFVALLVTIALQLLVMEGLAMSLFWPGDTGVDQAVSCLLIGLTCVFGPQLFRHIFSLRTIAPRLDRLLLAQIIANLALMAAQAGLFIAGLSPVILILEFAQGILATLLYLLVMVLLWRRRVPDVAVFVLGNGLMLLGGWLQSLQALVFPDRLGWLHYSLFVGALGNAACSTLVLRRQVRQIEAEKRLLLDQAIRQEKMASLGILSSSMAHDLANPNAAILQIASHAGRTMRRLAETIEDEMPAGPAPAQASRDASQLVAALADIGENGRRIGRILDDLRAFYQPRLPRPPARVDLAELVRSALRLVDALPHPVPVPILFNPPSDATLVVHGDFQRLEQALVNVLVNARQAIGKRRDGRIELLLEANGPDIRLAVRDNGPGMEEATLNRLGQAFFTTKGAGGSGLGLFITRKICEECRGRLEIESRPGQGTRVALCLPRDPSTPEEA